MLEEIVAGIKDKLEISDKPYDVVDAPDTSELLIHQIPSEGDAWLTVNVMRKKGEEPNTRYVRFDFGENPGKQWRKMAESRDSSDY